MTSNQTPRVQTFARIAGLLYVINIVAGVLGEVLVRNSIVVSGDAAATANHLVASTELWRIGIAGDLIMHITDVPLIMIFYVLFKPVNRNLALLAMLFTIVQTAALVANKLHLVTPLLLLSGSGYLASFSSEQLQSLAYLSIAEHGYGFGIGLIFFGCECLITGYLIFKSGFLPKILGPAIQLAGVCYLVNSFALILDPQFADMIFPAILLPCFIAELALALWLLIKGVDVAKWNALTASD